MKRKNFFFIMYILIFSSVLCASINEYGIEEMKTISIPVTVSPGSETELVEIWQNCPTFSWSAVEQAIAYKLVVFEIESPIIASYLEISEMNSPIIIEDIPGPALSWTLSSEKRFKTNKMYIWFIKAIDSFGNTLGNWSNGRMFKVGLEIHFAGVEEKLREILEGYGVTNDIISKTMSDLGDKIKEVVIHENNNSEVIKNKNNTFVSNGLEGVTNTFYGQFAGNSITTGFNDTYIGNRSGYATNTGYNNTFSGFTAGYNNTTGYSNTFMGHESGYANTLGNENTFIGRGSGYSNTTGSSNTFLGFYAGSGNTAGSFNTMIGFGSGNTPSTGDGNTYIGYETGKLNSLGSGNTFVGYTTGRSNSNGNYGTFLGYEAGKANTTGSNNLFLGYRSGYKNTQGTQNIFLGSSAGFSNINGYDDIFIGCWSGGANTTGVDNIFIGSFAGNHNTTGSNNLFFGFESGYYSTSGNINTFLGNSSGYYNTIGNENLFLGSYSGKSNNTGNSNTFVGIYSGYNGSSGSGNVFLGYKAGYNETSSNKLYISNSETNTPLIYGEFDNNTVTINGKLGVGTNAPLGTFEIEKTGANAVFIFERTDGAQGKFTARIGEIYIGSGSNHNVQIVANNNVIMTLTPVGNVGIGTSTPSNPLQMASGAYCSSGGTWTNASSKKLKENVRNLSTEEAFEALAHLEPVKFNYKADKADKHVGFIAEDVPDLVATPDRNGLSSMDITAVITKVIQEQIKVNQQQQVMIQKQMKLISDLRKRLEKIENEK